MNAPVKSQILKGKWFRRSVRVLLVMVLLCFVAVSLFKISKSRSFQFFGEMITTVKDDDKRVVLTFDDGPAENTSRIIEKLKELDIQATFFLCGKGIEERPEDAKAIALAGFEIGNHSYSHKRMILKSHQFVKEEIDKTNQWIRTIGYEGEIFFRPPYGKKLFLLPYYLEQKSITTVMWSMEPETVLGFDAEPKDIAEYIMKNVKGGDIILLHPMYNTDSILEALDLVVPQLKQQGYTFGTLADSK